MFFGVLGAAAQDDFRRILSFHIVSQIGYMIMGLALYTPLAIAGAIYFIIHNILAKMNLFLVSGIVKETNGHYLLKKLGGVYNRFPLISLLFAISAFSLAGVPPLSGFWGKFILAKAGLAVEEYFVVAVSLLVGFLTLYSMTKIWKAIFWSPLEENFTPISYENEKGFLRNHLLLILPSVFLTLCILMISLFPDFLISYATEAASDLMDNQVYIKAVLTESHER
jgi:multicomponent Na+:H+ antiporter subunit D